MLYIEPGSPWDNSYNESFNGKVRDELLDGKTFYTLQKAILMLIVRRTSGRTTRDRQLAGRSPRVNHTSDRYR